MTIALLTVVLSDLSMLLGGEKVAFNMPTFRFDINPIESNRRHRCAASQRH